MLTIKIVRRDSSDIRRVQIPTEGYSKSGMFRALNQAITSSFGLPSDRFLLSYLDDEGDRCGISGEDEMLEAVRLSQEGNKKKVLKIWLESINSNNNIVETKVEANIEVLAAEEDARLPAPLTPCVQFLEDVTLPDGTEVQGVTVVRKVWKVKNNGACVWPKGSFLRGANDVVKVALPCVPPGEDCLVSVDLKLPAQAGIFKEMYQLVSDPAFTGDTNLWVQLKIPAARPSASFVTDVKLEDGAIIAPDQIVKKTWAFKNDGKEDWPKNCKLVFIKGKLTPVKLEVPIPAAKVGEIATVNVDLRTPSCYGYHKALFELTGADGLKFENDFQAWCSLLIKPSVSKDDFLAVLPYMLKDADVLAATEQLLGLKPAHPGIYCNGCGIKSIRGTRFKCTICPDFDLCVDCEAKGDHPASHILLKLKQVLPNDTVNGIVDEKQKVWLKGKIHSAKAKSKFAKIAKKMSKHAAKQAKHAAKHAKCAAKLVAKQAKHVEKVAAKQMVKQAKHAAKAAKKAEKIMAKQAKHAAKAAKKAEKIVAKQAKQAAKAVKKAAKKAMRNEAKQAYKVVFVDDVTIPDGSNVMAGAVIQKTWRLKNAGATAWPEGTEIICVRGDATMIADTVAVSCAPGDTVDVSVDLKVGTKLGRSKTTFRLKIPSGRRIGAKLWLDIFVVVPATIVCVPTVEPQTEIESSPTVPVSEAPVATEPESAAVEVAPEPAEQEQKLSDAEEAAIAVLTEMGFTDRRMLISLLEAAGGDVQTVLGWLMAQPQAN